MTPEQRALNELAKYFVSGNSVPVERATIFAKDFWRIAGMAPDKPTCNQHPDAPHGFCRQASHGAGRYVCECEGWKPNNENQQGETMIGCIGHDGDCCTDREALQKDAERYRFLKSQHKEPEGDFWVEQNWAPSIKDLDAAIDEAMEKS